MGELVSEREQVLQDMFCSYDVTIKGGLNAKQLQLLHSELRIGGISLPQVEASVEYTCIGETCEMSELLDVLKEMDRRYFLIQDLCWEFTMLDRDDTDTICEDSAKWLVHMVYGKFFSLRKWELFLQQRAAPGSGISFPEIEVLLCNIPSVQDLMDEEQDRHRLQQEHDKEQREMQQRLQAERNQKDMERRASDAIEVHQREEEERRQLEEEEERSQRKKEDEEAERRERELRVGEGRGQAEAAQRQTEMAEAMEAERLRKEELDTLHKEQADGDECNRIYEEEKRMEKEAEIEAVKQHTKWQHVRDAALKKEAEAAERRARMKAREHHNMKLRYNLKYSIKKRDRVRLPVAVDDFKKAKLPDDDQDLPKADRIMSLFQAADGLKKAMQSRKLPELEKAINFVKHHGFEPQLHNEMRAAHLVLLQLRQLERIRAEILELKQSTVAEIRSYSKPPPIVHTIMTATFLLLGHKERETRVWKHVQALVGKTGKEGLKRCCLQAEPSKISPTAAERAGTLLAKLDLEEVRDVSAGAATFFVWSTTMIEENELYLQAKALEEEEREKEAEEKKQLAAEEKERKKAELAEEEERKKAIEEAKLEALEGVGDGAKDRATSAE